MNGNRQLTINHHQHISKSVAFTTLSNHSVGFMYIIVCIILRSNCNDIQCPTNIPCNPVYLETPVNSNQSQSSTIINTINTTNKHRKIKPLQSANTSHYNVEEEQPEFKQIAEDILHNEGPTYDYIMEHPPNDRILPVLEKVVNELKHPMLDSAKNNRNAKTYEKDIEEFFKEQICEYKLHETLKKTCVLFKKNTNDTDFNTFELFINILDIYDRMLYNNDQNITKAKQITDTKFNGINNSHFAEKLNENDCSYLNESIHIFKEGKQSFFKKLENQKQNDKIKDNIRDYQCIALSFILFIKAFMCETGNCLERGNHKYKAPRNRQQPFKVNIQSLIDIKKQRKNEYKVEIEIDDNDIFFHNDNMPLQFDLCILPKYGNKDYNNYGLDEKFNDFVIHSMKYETPNDKKSIYKLYGDLAQSVTSSDIIKSICKHSTIGKCFGARLHRKQLLQSQLPSKPKNINIYFILMVKIYKYIVSICVLHKISQFLSMLSRELGNDEILQLQIKCYNSRGLLMRAQMLVKYLFKVKIILNVILNLKVTNVQRFYSFQKQWDDGGAILSVIKMKGLKCNL